eukprot:749031-Hanusia_phi.AAC.1
MGWFWDLDTFAHTCSLPEKFTITDMLGRNETIMLLLRTRPHPREQAGRGGEWKGSSGRMSSSPWRWSREYQKQTNNAPRRDRRSKQDERVEQLSSPARGSEVRWLDRSCLCWSRPVSPLQQRAEQQGDQEGTVAKSKRQGAEIEEQK